MSGVFVFLSVKIAEGMRECFILQGTYATITLASNTYASKQDNLSHLSSNRHILK
jgi:hypothetical protein